MRGKIEGQGTAMDRMNAMCEEALQKQEAEAVELPDPGACLCTESSNKGRPGAIP